MTQIAFVTGATGYLAQHLTRLLLAKKYKVIGSVRSDAKGESLQSLFKDPNFSYAVVTDVAAAGAFDEVLKSNPTITTIYHTAAPVSSSSPDLKKSFLEPALDGTLNILNAVKNHAKNVSRFVMTSSYVAVGFSPNFDYHNYTVTEESWSNLDWDVATKYPGYSYPAAKTLAERAAWDFVAKEKPNFKFAVVNPPYILGPNNFDSDKQVNATVSNIFKVLKAKTVEELPAFDGTFIDVRDAAQAHIVAGESEEAVNKRLLLVSEIFNRHLILKVIRDNFPELRETLPEVDEAGLASLKDSYFHNYDSSKTNAILGFKFISFEKSVVDSVKQYLAQQKA